ncbi:uncharacterized protein LOC120629638 [Pararge aegeria]|uniref:uncharacterized protein LOC120629638 n=1 Tax=Pararge aegeria TaxID=116150 RepID=UPI0019D1985A|nr:uncharacterized protein LOC120629638 [Pararge aegeria]
MKLPFSIILGPVLKLHFTKTKLFCKNLTFSASVPYTYVFSTLGLFINIHHIKKHLGEIPEISGNEVNHVNRNKMLVHDLKIIATSMGLVQYTCLLVGCLTINSVTNENSDGIRVKLRALLVGLLGVSMSACAFASQPVELELDDDDVTQKLNNVSFARRLTKPTIRLVMGYSKLSAFVTCSTSLLLLLAVMSKQSWWKRGARWLAAPALLVAALETASDASDALLAAVLRGSAAPALLAAQTISACFLITVEILVWYFIAKLFEYNPPPLSTDLKKDIFMETPLMSTPL